MDCNFYGAPFQSIFKQPWYIIHPLHFCAIFFISFLHIFYFAPLFFILLLYFLYLFPLIFIYLFSSTIIYFVLFILYAFYIFHIWSIFVWDFSHTRSAPAIFIYLFIYLFISRFVYKGEVLVTWFLVWVWEDWVPVYCVPFMFRGRPFLFSAVGFLLILKFFSRCALSSQGK